MLQGLVDLISGAWWVYPLIAGVSALDVVFPLVPSETVVITAGIVAADGDLLLPAVIALAAAGAFAGDNAVYLLGRFFGERARGWLARGDRGKRTLRTAERWLDAHGSTLIVAGRYLPGLRTATALSAGITEFSWRRFIVFDAIGSITWASLAASLGYAGGHLSGNPLISFALSFGVAATIAVLIELGRYLLKRRGRR